MEPTNQTQERAYSRGLVSELYHAVHNTYVSISAAFTGITAGACAGATIAVAHTQQGGSPMESLVLGISTGLSLAVGTTSLMSCLFPSDASK